MALNRSIKWKCSTCIVSHFNTISQNSLFCGGVSVIFFKSYFSFFPSVLWPKVWFNSILKASEISSQINLFHSDFLLFPQLFSLQFYFPFSPLSSCSFFLGSSPSLIPTLPPLSSRFPHRCSPPHLPSSPLSGHSLSRLSLAFFFSLFSPPLRSFLFPLILSSSRLSPLVVLRTLSIFHHERLVCFAFVCLLWWFFLQPQLSHKHARMPWCVHWNLVCVHVLARVCACVSVCVRVHVCALACVCVRVCVYGNTESPADVPTLIARCLTDTNLNHEDTAEIKMANSSNRSMKHTLDETHSELTAEGSLREDEVIWPSLFLSRSLNPPLLLHTDAINNHTHAEWCPQTELGDSRDECERETKCEKQMEKKELIREGRSVMSPHIKQERGREEPRRVWGHFLITHFTQHQFSLPALIRLKTLWPEPLSSVLFSWSLSSHGITEWLFSQFCLKILNLYHQRWNISVTSSRCWGFIVKCFSGVEGLNPGSLIDR